MKDTLNINIHNFNGPLDLLLDLIKDKKTDIFDVNLVELANDYLRIINEIKDTNLEVASEYLVMAATLIQIKARLLLLEPEKEEETVFEDKAKLLKLLAEYQQFKKISTTLREQEFQRSLIHIKSVSNYENFYYEKDPAILDTKSSSKKLIQIMRQMFERISAEKIRMVNVDSVNITTEDQANFIRQLFKKHQKITFDMVFKFDSINHFVVTMIAILDMSRKQEIYLEQNEQFGDIFIYKGNNYEI